MPVVHRKYPSARRAASKFVASRFKKIPFARRTAVSKFMRQPFRSAFKSHAYPSCMKGGRYAGSFFRKTSSRFNKHNGYMKFCR